jgi:hypothetical protein
MYWALALLRADEFRDVGRTIVRYIFALRRKSVYSFTVQRIVSCDVTTYSLADTYRHFGKACFLHLHGKN